MKDRRSIGYREILDSLSEEKRRADGPWTRFVLRPLSFPTSWVFLRLGLSPNAVTYISAVFCLAGFLFLASGIPWAAWTGFVLFFAFGVLDCADGNMARSLGTASPWGEWVDALGGYTAYATVLLGMGALADAAFGKSIPGLGLELPWAGGWTLVGGAAAASNSLMRAVFQNFRVVRGSADRGEVGGEKRLSETIGITGFLVPLAALGYALGFLPWVVAGYFVVYAGGALLVILKLVGRVEGEIRKGGAR